MLLNSQDFSQELFSAINSANQHLFICSAFIKESSVRQVLGKLDSSLSVFVVSRWQKQDLMVGASDLSVYEYCRENGWRFGIDLKFHGKVYLIDSDYLFIGSANFTGKGLNLHSGGNNEFGTCIKPNFADLTRLQKFLQEDVVWLDDHLYQQLKHEVENSISNQDSIIDTRWSHDLLDRIEVPINYIWVHELPFKKPYTFGNLDLRDNDFRHDYQLFELDIDDISDAILKKKFRSSRVYAWLRRIVDDNSSINFGGITQALHSALLDDPKPYRKDVKSFVEILFSWMAFLEDEFILQKYKRTTSVSLINKKT